MFDVPTKTLETAIAAVIPVLPQNILETRDVLAIMRRQQQFFASSKK